MNGVIFKGHAKIIKIYKVEFNVTILNRPRIMKFSKCKVKHK